MNQLIMCIAGLLFCTGCFAGKTSQIPDKELTLTGVGIGDHEARIFMKLGKPRKVESAADHQIEFQYDGLVIWLGKDRRVEEIYSTNSQHCTPAKVCPGQKLSYVRAKYGKPILAKREDGEFIEYAGVDSACWLQMTVRRATVKSIRIECQP